MEARCGPNFVWCSDHSRRCTTIGLDYNATGDSEGPDVTW